MFISLLTAWIATICVILTAIKYFTKNHQKMNRLFHRIHIPLGILLIGAGLIHGIFAGNRLGTSLSQASLGQILFSWNMGTACLILALLLGITYLLRKRLKKNWIVLHRIFTLLLVVAVGIHIFQMGITFPSALMTSLGSDTSYESSLETDSSDSHSDSGNNSSDSSASNSDSQNESSDSSSSNSDSQNGSSDSSNSNSDSQNESSDSSSSNSDSQNESSDSSNSTGGLVTFSGATYSCKGIQEAVYDALSDAVISGELEITEMQISDSHGHGGRKSF